jgi:hypothetical protein
MPRMEHAECRVEIQAISLVHQRKLQELLASLLANIEHFARTDDATIALTGSESHRPKAEIAPAEFRARTQPVPGSHLPHADLHLSRNRRDVAVAPLAFDVHHV